MLARRPHAIRGVHYTRDVKKEIDALLRHCATSRIEAREGRDHDLERIAQMQLHEGLVVRTAPRVWTPSQAFSDALVDGRGVAVALDRVRNPYNIGAILRSAAFLGVDAAILGALAHGPALPASAVRVAEGGTEHLMLSRTSDLGETLRRLRKRGVHVVGADGASRESLFEHRFARPTIIVMGHEREGISDRVRAQCDAMVAIPGTGAVESLNVAVAAGLLFGELVRTRRR